jgi:MFS family permease
MVAMRRFALYAGGFLGPFGGGVMTVLIPDLREHFGVSTGVASLVLPAYLVPFAALQLVSGTIGGRFGAARTVRIAYVAYALASLAAAATSVFGTLLVARALQGAANAFTTPLLLAALAESVAVTTLGRTMGTFAAVQTAGVVSSPLLGGLAGEVDFRLAFVVPAIVAAALALVPLPGRGRRPEHVPGLRSALNRRVAWVSAGAFLAFLAITGVSLLVALRAADDFGVGPTARGALLASFGFAGVVVGRPAGTLVDRYGRVPVACTGALACAVAVPLLGLVPNAWWLAATWLAAGIGSALVWAGLNTLAVEASPANRAGAVSFIGAWKFAGNAVAPLVWVPLYEIRTTLAFGLAGVGCLVLAETVRRVTRA